jgi:hypothetical protein
MLRPRKIWFWTSKICHGLLLSKYVPGNIIDKDCWYKSKNLQSFVRYSINYSGCAAVESASSLSYGFLFDMFRLYIYGLLNTYCQGAVISEEKRTLLKHLADAGIH